jgi:translation initiation factor 4A
MEEIVRYESFEDMGLKEPILRAIFSYGCELPSAIQSKAIVPFISGISQISQANSGSGKTLSFAIGCLSRVDLEICLPQAIVLSPTRELSEQTMNVFGELNIYLKARIAMCIGGTQLNSDLDALEQGAQIVIGTPGRIYDLIVRGALIVDKMKMFILDEADEMLSAGFKEQIYNIFTKLPEKDLQIALFSATLPTEVLALTEKFMKNPIKILVKKEQLTLEGIKQYYINLEKEDWKIDTLIDIYKIVVLAQTIIYVNSKNKCDYLTRRLKERNYPVVAMHGNISPEERKSIMDKFRNGESRILISTDLLARGIDVQQVSLVINYDLPTNIENYLHRIGRSGRYGRKGVAITFCTMDDIPKLRELERYYVTQIDALPADISKLF